MSPFLEHEEVSPLFVSSPVSWNNPWHELRDLANRAGVSTDYLCSLVEAATWYAPEGKSADSGIASKNDLDYVAHFLSEDAFPLSLADFSFVAKTTWNEWEHPRDDKGRFTDGQSHSGAHQMGSLPQASPPSVNHAQALADLHTVSNELKKLFPNLNSRWKGVLIIEPNMRRGIVGEKSWTCSITIAQQKYADQAGLLCTMIHEMFHAYSPTNQGQYSRAKRWEEGAIENAVRIHRQQIAYNMGWHIPQSQFEARDAKNGYNHYVDALDSIRSLLGIPYGPKFYDDLMALPADQIEPHLISLSNNLSPSKKARFDRRFRHLKLVLDGK